MSIDNLNTGDSLAGLLADGRDDTPYVGATLRIVERGVEVEVPYLSGYEEAQFAHVDDWFNTMTLPENMQLRTAQGAVMLYGCRWRGHTGPGGLKTATGRLSPEEALLHSHDGDLTEPLRAKTCRSRMDGLNRWSRLRSVSDDFTPGDGNRAKVLDVHVEAPPIVEWQQGEATLRLQTAWGFHVEEDGYERSHVLSDNVVLESEWAEPRAFFDHLREQRKVLHLLTFMTGERIAFREHRVQDELITDRLMSGDVYDHPFAELISQRTVAERLLPRLTTKQLQMPLLALAEIGPAGLAAWAEKYDEWQRFILPAAAVIGRKQRYSEDVVVSTSMSLEAAGQLLGERPNEAVTYRGRQRTMATYLYRCLEFLDIRWGDHIHSQVGLARAIADNYRAVKHADRGDFPDHTEMYLVGTVNELVARLLAASLTGRADDLLLRYREGDEAWEVRQRFEANQMRIADELGNWVSTSGSEV